MLPGDGLFGIMKLPNHAWARHCVSTKLCATPAVSPSTSTCSKGRLTLREAHFTRLWLRQDVSDAASTAIGVAGIWFSLTVAICPLSAERIPDSAVAFGQNADPLCREVMH